jgi:hypothetical protein
MIYDVEYSPYQWTWTRHRYGSLGVTGGDDRCHGFAWIVASDNVDAQRAKMHADD